MELRHLRYFVAVAEALSFTKAAGKLHTAQPSLTRQIKDLEEELGVQLLNRTKQQVSLTDEGRSFLADAKRLLALAAETVESVRRLHSGESRALNIGYVSNLFYDLLPNTLASSVNRFPPVSVNLFDLSCGDQLRALEMARSILGFAGLHEPIAMRGLQFRTDCRPYKTVVRLAEKGPYGAQIRREPQRPCADVLHRHVGSELPFLSRLVNQDCDRAGFIPKVLQDVDLERTMIHAVAAGLGVALVPEQVKKFEHENVVFRPLNPTVRTEGCVAWKDNNPSAALKAYVQIVEQVGRSIR
jgi:DNA-binding transcriptional LysR family regulator